MEFIIITNKWANFYFFFHNLAECKWPWPYRPEINKAWKKELGSFTEKEEQAIKKFRKIYQNHFLKLYLGRPFFLEKNPWKALEKKLSQKETSDLKEIFSIWQEKFEIIYKKDLPNLQAWKRKLNLRLKRLNKSSQIKSVSKTLSVLYNCPPPKSNIRVYLMLSKEPASENYASGAGGERGRGLDGKSVLIELSRCPTQKMNYVIGILWHEVIHSCFAPHYLIPLLSKILKKKKLISFIEEIINRSLFPIGILSIKLLKAPFPSTLARGFISNIDSEQTIKIINFTNQYVQRNKSFDKYYIKELLRILKKSP